MGNPELARELPSLPCFVSDAGFLTGNQMSKRSLRLGQALFCLLMLSFLPVGAAEAWLHIHGATLLLGEGSDLHLISDAGEFSITPPTPTNGGHATSPSISPDGNLIATAYVKVPYPRNASIPIDERLARYKEGVAVDFVRENRWRLYGEFYNVWAVAIAPDKSRVAVIAEDSWNSPHALSLINLTTGEVSTLVGKFSGGPIRWAPDGTYLAYSVLLPLKDPHYDIREYEVHLLDLRSMDDSRVTAGVSPSWSPAGDWIAFITNSGECAMVHPDGTGERILVGLSRNPPWFFKRRFIGHPVWSPDSTRLLLNEDADDDTARVLIHEFDLRTGKRKRLTGKVALAVLAWSVNR